MKKIEAKTLESAYSEATKIFGCSITELDCEIIQYPISGFLGLFAKNAIIVVNPKTDTSNKASKKESSRKKPIQAETKTEIEIKSQVSSTPDTQNDIENIKKKSGYKAEENIVVEEFLEAEAPMDEINTDTTSTNNIPLQEEIEAELASLIKLSCFDIDTVEVDVIDDTAYIFMDGEDAALLIGKEGYRYNALSYLVSNWLQNRYNLYLKLEIAQFLASQQEMIRSYMEPVIEHVEQKGSGRTRVLNGVLVQIALEQLREEFPNKYVAIKKTRNGERYVLINEFNKR